MRLRCDVLSYLNWRDHYIRRMAVRAHRRDHELADTLTMLRSRVGYTQHKFHQAASLLYLPSRVNLFSSTRWSEAALSTRPLGSQCRPLGSRASSGRAWRHWAPRHSQGEKPSHGGNDSLESARELTASGKIVELTFNHPDDSRFNLGERERTRMRRAGAKAKAAGRFSVAAGVAVPPGLEGNSCDTAACYAAAGAAPSGTGTATGSVEFSLDA